jgi:hypothetical protein
MMGAMSQEQQASGTGPVVPSPAGVSGVDGPAAAGSPPHGAAEVVAWGDERAQPPGRSPRWLSGLVHDRRVVPLTAALGGVALFASLISEWQVTVVDGTAFGESQVGQRPIVVGVADLDAWGGGYLVGLLLLTASMVLMLFGAPAGRAYARLVALSTGGVLLALLAALLYDLDTHSLAFSPAETLFVEEAQVSLAAGRGGYCAVVGVLAILLAAALAGRQLRTGAVAQPGRAGPAPAPGDDEPDADRPWRRPRDTGDDDAPDVPFELSVSPAEPFTPLTDGHDTYRRPDAISG